MRLHAGRAALVALAAIVASAGCGSSSQDQGRPQAVGLRVEKAVAATGEGTEVVVSVEEPGENVSETAKGKRSVTLQCVDSAGTVLVRGRHRWPFTDTDQGLLDAHVHQAVPASRLGALKRCELRGTRGPLTGRVTGPG